MALGARGPAGGRAQASALLFFFILWVERGEDTGRSFAMVTVPRETPSLPLILRDDLV